VARMPIMELTPSMMVFRVFMLILLEF
jgi:hypothetical protein